MSTLKDKITQFGRDLDLIESLITQLRREYDLYFSGQLKNQPIELRKRLESLIRKYRNAQIQKTEIQFRYATLVSRFNSYCDFWEKIFKRREKDPKAISPWSPNPEFLLAGETGMNTYLDKSAQLANGKNGKKEPTRDDPAWKLFTEFLEAKKSLGEPTNGLTYDSFKKVLEKQKEQILQKKSCREVEFKVNVKDGKVILKARAVQDDDQVPAAVRGGHHSL